jgi:hypothetical protein
VSEPVVLEVAIGDTTHFLRFDDEAQRDAFMNHARRGEAQMRQVYTQGGVKLWMRPASVDVMRA